MKYLLIYNKIVYDNDIAKNFLFPCKIISQIFIFMVTIFMKKNMRLMAFLLSILLYCSSSISVFAANSSTFEEQRQERMSLPIQTNEIKSWPAGPEIGAQAAILMDAETGVILYAKNIHEKLYPASTTKIMTTLLAVEHGNLTDPVSFSHEAVFSIPRDSSNIGMDVGESISLEQCLYGIMVGSANECANACAEHIAGNIEDFVTLMNEKAVSLGCKNTHFANSNGLFDENHYTSAYDLALIAKEFFQNETLLKIGNTARYHFTPTNTQPDDFYLRNKHKLINGELAYKGILGGKTGYTSEARETLVTCAEQNGMKLICVILKEESPYQFTDTETLFNYGFSNFQSVKISDYDTTYTIDNNNFFKIGKDVFGNSQPILTLNSESTVILPNNCSFDTLTSEIQYTDQDTDPSAFASVSYYYEDMYVGCAEILLTSPIQFSDQNETDNDLSILSDPAISLSETESDNTTLFVNIDLLLFIIAGISIILIFINCFINFFKDYHFSGVKRSDRFRRNRFSRK